TVLHFEDPGKRTLGASCRSQRIPALWRNGATPAGSSEDGFPIVSCCGTRPTRTVLTASKSPWRNHDCTGLLEEWTWGWRDACGLSWIQARRGGWSFRPRRLEEGEGRPAGRLPWPRRLLAFAPGAQ